jgi:anion-transporting  ArsA/GET3 family ATPase
VNQASTRAASLDGVELWARMPDARQSVDRFAEWLFQDPEALERVRKNGMYRELGDSLAACTSPCVAFVDHELESGRWDHVVLDTAPSRHALEFFDYPGRLARMLRRARCAGSRACLFRRCRARRPTDARDSGLGSAASGALVGNLVGAAAIHDIAALFGELLVRERWPELVQRVERRLADAETLFLVVTGPSGAALDDADYLMQELEQRRLTRGAVILNRAVAGAPSWLGDLAEARRIQRAAETLEQRRATGRRGRSRPGSLRALTRAAWVTSFVHVAGAHGERSTACGLGACRRDRAQRSGSGLGHF